MLSKKANEMLYFRKPCFSIRNKTIYLVAKQGEFRIFNNAYTKYAFIHNNRD
jgi:hypothetical protein